MGLHRLTSLVFYLDNNECPLIRGHRWVLPGFEMVLRRMLKSHRVWSSVGDEALVMILPRVHGKLLDSFPIGTR